MSYWVVHREQVTGELQIDLYEEKLVADLKQRHLRREYHDVVILQEKDIEKLYHYQKGRKHEGKS